MPIVISGVGGSGTRVVAEMLLDLGYFMGHDLDRARDNLSFSLLFMRPEWLFHHARWNPAETGEGLEIFTKAMTRRYLPTPHELRFLAGILCEKRGVTRRRWRLKRLAKLLSGRHFDPAVHSGWGWKEPISHLYIESLAKRFAGLKWIHVIRHGLDMAYSENQRQLKLPHPVIPQAERPRSGRWQAVR